MLRRFSGTSLGINCFSLYQINFRVVGLISDWILHYKASMKASLW
jgi:hypothetical protein